MLTKHCPYKAACKFLRKTLRKAEASLAAIAPCPAEVSSLPCSCFVSNTRLLYDVLPSEAAAPALELIEALFGKEKYFCDAKDPVPKAPKFFCPELQIRMTQSCSLTSCPFYTSNSFVQNCILRYLDLQDKDSLSYNELIFLLNLPSGLVRAKVASALKRSRKAVIKKLIEKGDQDGLFTRIYSTNVCPVCEASTLTKEKLTKKGITFCSVACATAKPPKVLQVEQEFNYPIGKLLSLCRTQFTDKKLIKSALGLSSKLLKQLFRHQKNAVL